MVRMFAETCLGILLLAAPAFAQSPQPVSPQDRRFLEHAAKDSQGEIRLALLAVKQAKNPAVKAYARLMVGDHATLETQLANVLGELQVRSSDGMTRQDRKDWQALEHVSGPPFDAAFMRAQVKDHRQDVQDFVRERAETHNFAMSALIATTLPILQQHLALAEAVEAYAAPGSQQAAAQLHR